jgi:hypothetical protein
LILPVLLPVALSLGMAASAFYSDLSLVPLVLVIGLASHWPAVGWLYETSIFTVHAIVRVLLAVAIWFLLPEARFTLLPLSIGGVRGHVILDFARSAAVRKRLAQGAIAQNRGQLAVSAGVRTDVLVR